MQIYLRSCGIYANETAVAGPQVDSIGDETRFNKNLDPVEMYWRSCEIYENEPIAADTKDTPVVDMSVEDMVDDTIVGDEGYIWEEVPKFSVETCSRDCVSVNWWVRDAVYEDPGGLYKSGCPDKLCVGDLEKQNGKYILGDELDGKLVLGGPNEWEGAGSGEMDEEVHTVQDWDNNGAKKHLATATERNVKICKKRVRPATLHVGSKAHYFGPCRYVERWPKRQSNHFGPLLIVDIYSPEAASKQRSQRSDARVLHTDKLRLFLCMAPVIGWMIFPGLRSLMRQEPLWSLGLASVDEDPSDHLA